MPSHLDSDDDLIPPSNAAMQNLPRSLGRPAVEIFPTDGSIDRVPFLPGHPVSGRVTAPRSVADPAVQARAAFANVASRFGSVPPLDPPYWQQLAALGLFVVTIDYGGTGRATADGITDDTAAIVNHMTLASHRGGIVYFPPGLYVASLVVPGNVCLLGAGMYRSIILRPLDATKVKSPIRHIDGGAWDIQVVDLGVNGRATPGYITAHGCALSNVNRALILRCAFFNCMQHGLLIWDNCSNIVVSECVSVGNGIYSNWSPDPMKPYPAGFGYYLGRYADANQGPGYEPTNITYHNCHAEYNYSGYDCFASTSVQYIGCTAHRNWTGGFGTDSGSRVRYVSCLAWNMDENVGIKAGAIGFAVWNGRTYNHRPPFDIVFDGCIADGCKTGFNFNGGSDPLTPGTRVILTGCSSLNNGRFNNTQAGRGLLCDNMDDLAMTGCVVQGNASDGILLRGVHTATISGCIIKDNSKRGDSYSDGVRLTDYKGRPTVDVSITGNRIGCSGVPRHGHGVRSDASRANRTLLVGNNLTGNVVASALAELNFVEANNLK